MAVLASVLALIGASPAVAAPPAPETSLAVPASGFIGDSLQFTVTFDNADTTAAGYGPFVDLFLPASGIDGDDGITFDGATYLGAPVTSTVIPITSCPVGGHPYLPGSVTCPTGFGVGDQLVVLELPFGSFTPDQPPAAITVDASVSELADVDKPLPIAATAAFRYGDSPTGSTPIVQDPPTTATHTPELLRLSKRYLGPEDETATGPNFPRQYELAVAIAPGQTIDPLTLTDLLPDNIVYLGVDSTVPTGGTTTVEPPDTTDPHNPTDNELTVGLGAVTGTGGDDGVVTFGFYVPDLDADGDSVIDAASGDDVESANEAAAAGTWDPIDTRDGSAISVSAGDSANPEHVLDDKSIAIQKGVSVSDDVGAEGPSPGDTLTYTLDFQVSDHFTFGSVTATDVFTDGQTLDPDFAPTLSFDDDDDSISGAFDAGNHTVTRDDAPCGNGSTQIDFDISSAIIDLDGDGVLTGGLALSGDTGATTGTITFRTVIDSNYACLDAGDPLDSNDALSNAVTIDGEVLDNATQAPQATPRFEADGSGAGVDIVAGSLDKHIYARNDTLPTDPSDPDGGLPTLTQFAPGDSITYRLTATEPLTNVEDLSLVDFLPLPVLQVPGTVPFDTSPNPTGALPAVGGARFGPNDTFSAATGVTPTTSTDAVANSVSFEYGDYQGDPGTESETIDILLRLPISDDPFVDGLFLTNQVRKYFDNSFEDQSFLDEIIQIDLTQPELHVTKGVVASDNDEAVFSPGNTGPVTFTDPVGSATAPRWTGAITSDGLAANPIDSNVTRGVDAGDLVTFAITVENQGRGLYGAFNVELADSVPAGYELPAPADLNLQVTDGAGTALPYTDLGGGLFGSGVALDDIPAGPGPEQGSLAPYNPATGANIAVVTYNLRLDHTPDPDTVSANQTLRNTATLGRYTSTSTGANFVPGGVTDDATVRTDRPQIDKTTTGTDQVHTTGNDVAVGEQVTYEVRIRVPEGEHPDFTVTDTLDTGLAFVSFDRVGFDPDPGPLTTSLPVLSDAIDPGNVAVTPADTGQAGAGRVATFDFGTITNTDDDNSTDEEIVLTYTAVVLNTGGNQNADPTRLNNRVTTSYSGSDSAPDVAVVEPVVRVDKSVDPTVVDAGDRVTFTIVATNAAGDGADATAFDIGLADVVPAGFTYVPGTFTHDAGLAPDSGPDDTGAPTLTAAWDEMVVGSTSTFTFDADVDADIDAAVLAAGLTNTAEVRFTSLPEDGPANSSPYNGFGVERTGDPADPGGSANDYRDTDPATVDLVDPGVVKALLATSEDSTSGADVAIGEVASYRLRVTLPEGELSGFSVSDLLPAGLGYVGGSATVLTSSPALTEDFGGTLPVPAITPTGDGASGQDLVLEFGATSVTAGNPYDNSFVVEFDATTLDVAGNRGDDPATTGTDEATVLTNTAQVDVGGVVGTSEPVDVTVVEPIMAITKAFEPGQAAANDTVTVRLTVENVGDADAFDVNVDDLLEGDFFPTGGIAEATTPAGFGYSAAAEGNNDTRITYTGGDLAMGETVEFTFTVTLADPVPVPGSVTNTATVTDATTLPTDHPGGDDAERNEPDVDDQDELTFTAPDLRVVKNDGVQVRTPGELFAYTITVFNDGGRDATGVELTDTLPADVAFALASDGGTETAPGSGIVTWPQFDLAAGASRSFTLAVTVDDPLPEPTTDFLNTVEVAEDGTHGADPNPDDNTDTDLDTAGTVVDIGVVKDDGTQVRGAGEQVTYTLTVTNHGNQGESGIDLTDTLPANTTFVSASGGGTETAPGSGIITWPAFALDGAGGATDDVTRTVTVEIDDPLPAGVESVVNGVTVDSPDDANPDNDTDNDTDTVGAAPDLTITKDDGVTQAAPGDSLTYDVVVTNVGDQTATGVNVTDTLPDGVTFESATDGGTETAPGSGVVVWDLGSLAGAGGTESNTATVSVTVTVDDPVPTGQSELVNTAVVADDGTNGPDPTPDDNTGTDTDALVPDLRIEKDDGVQIRTPGEAFTYTLRVVNDGGVTATGVEVTDALPDELEYVSASGTGSHSGEPTGGDVSWDPFDLAGGESASVTVTVRLVDPVANDLTQVVNAASVTDDGANGPDPTPADNTDTDTDTVIGTIDLAIAKDDGTQTRTPGEQYTYTLGITNIGDRDAVDAVVTDTLPTGLAFVSASDGGTETSPGSGIVTWPAFALGGDGNPSGNTTTRTVTVTVDDPVAAGIDALRNDANVTTPGDDNATNDDDSDVDVLDAAPDLNVTKDDGRSVVVPGDTITYDVLATNVGDQGATGVVVTDTLPDDTTFVSATGGGTETAPGSGVVTWGPLDLDGPGGDDTVSFSVTATVDEPLPKPTVSITNTVTVADDGTNGTDPTPGDNTDSDTDLTITDLRVEKNDGVQTRQPGDEYTYTLDVFNDGGVTATGVTVVDTLPADVAFQSASSTGSHDGSALAGEVTWDPFTLAGGEQVTLTVTVRLRDPVPNGTTDIVNAVAVGHDETLGPDPTPDDNTDTDTDSTDSVIDVGVEKDDGTQTRRPGDQYSYVLTVTNHGDEDAVDAVVTDTLPADVSLVSATGGGTETAPGSGVVTWGPFDLGGAGHADGNVVTFTVTVRVDDPIAAGVDELVNRVTVAAPGDVNDLNDDDTDTDTVDATPDLTITKTDGQPTAVEGETLPYTLTIDNVGDQGATGVEIVDELPTGVTFVSASDGGSESSPGVVTWPTVDLAGSGSGSSQITRTVTVTVDEPLPDGTTELVNRATVAEDGANGVDPTPGDNTDTDVDATGADLSVTKTDGQLVATPGTALTYEIVVSNAGPETLDRIQLDDTIPPELLDVTFTPSEGSYDATTGEWTGIDLPPGDTIELSVDATVDPSARGPLVNVVTVSSPDHADPTPDDNTATDTDGLLPEFDLTIDKDAVGSFTRGGSGTYRFVITNNGPSAAADVEVVDELPEGIGFVNVDAPAGWSCEDDDDRLTCRHPDPYLPGSAETIDLTVAVADDAPTQIDNVATVSSTDDNIDRDVSVDDQDEASVEVPLPPVPTGTDPGDGDGAGSSILPRTGAALGTLILLGLGLIVGGRALRGRRPSG